MPVPQPIADLWDRVASAQKAMNDAKLAHDDRLTAEREAAGALDLATGEYLSLKNGLIDLINATL